MGDKKNNITPEPIWVGDKKNNITPEELPILEKYGNGKQLTPEESKKLNGIGITKQNIKKLANNQPELNIR